MKRKLYIITLEPIDKRYTKQWYEYWREEFSKQFDVTYINGGSIENQTITNGKFLDINKTNIWKANQIKEMSILFNENKINNEDIFLFMDGWHYGITPLKYMAQLNKLTIKIYGYYHAGSWDKYDFISQNNLGKWCSYNECGWMNALDGIFVATKFHKSIIKSYFNGMVKTPVYVVGFPMDWIKEIEKERGRRIWQHTKENIIVFPHRLDKEKQPDIFDELAKQLPQYKFIKTNEVTNTKKEYYDLLAKAKIVFSANLQETFGIGIVEGLMLDAVPLVPNRLSYIELYDKYFIYDTMMSLKSKIIYIMNNYHKYSLLTKQIMKNKEKIIESSKKSIDKMMWVM